MACVLSLNVHENHSSQGKKNQNVILYAHSLKKIVSILFEHSSITVK